MQIVHFVEEEEEEESDDEDDAFGPKKSKEEEEGDAVARKWQITNCRNMILEYQNILTFLQNKLSEKKRKQLHLKKKINTKLRRKLTDL